MNIKTFTFGPFQENTYILFDKDTKEAIIVDAGCMYDKEKNNLMIFIEENNLTVKYLLNTHLHIDHQFGNKFITDNFGVAPLAGKEDEFLLNNIKSQAAMFGLPANEDAQKLGGYITEGQLFDLGNSSLKAIHCPGHSPGSMVLYSENDGFLIAGDVLFNGSIGRTDLPKGDYATLINSITKKLLVLPNSTVVYCGHGPTTTIGNEKINNPYL